MAGLWCDLGILHLQLRHGVPLLLAVSGWMEDDPERVKSGGEKAKKGSREAQRGRLGGQNNGMRGRVKIPIEREQDF